MLKLGKTHPTLSLWTHPHNLLHEEWLKTASVRKKEHFSSTISTTFQKVAHDVVDKQGKLALSFVYFVPV